MKNILPFVCILCLLGVAGFNIQAETGDPTDGSADVEELKKRISSLEEQLASIEDRMQKNTLTMIKMLLSLEEATAKSPGAPTGRERLPKGSVRRDFNGMRFYLVPVDRSPKTMDSGVVEKVPTQDQRLPRDSSNRSQ